MSDDDKTKLKAPKGAESISFGKKVWKVVDGYIHVAEDYVEHLLKHGNCTVPTAAELAATEAPAAAPTAKPAAPQQLGKK